MSMVITTALQLVEVFCAYLCVTIVLPWIVLGKTLHLRNRFEKFMIYTMFGNFYVMYLVFILELLHISHPVTLILGTVVPCFMIKVKLENIPVVKIILEKWDTFRRLVGGQLGLKAYRDLRRPARKAFRKKIAKHFVDVYVVHIVEVVLIILLFAMIFYVYGISTLTQFGYKASDVVVHNRWINSLSENDIFSTGVYPYGFHATVYYIHSVFRIDTYIILRLISFVETTWVYLMMLCFLKLICKSKYIPYIGVYTYALAGFYSEATYTRFLASLPQEYGMIFILPAIYAGFMYFRSERRYKRGDRSGHEKMYLVVFAISFAMTLAVHFYGTIITGLYCLAMAIGFIGWFLRRPCFKRVVFTFLISFVIAVSPMAIAYATGTPLQASLDWAVGVFTGNPVHFDDEKDKDPEYVEPSIVPDEYIEKYGERLGEAVYYTDAVKENISLNTIYFDDNNFVYIAMGLPGILLILGFLTLIFKRDEVIYAMAIISTGIFSLFMLIVHSSEALHIPALMDTNRAGIYMCYTLTAAAALAADSFFFLLMGSTKKRWIINTCTFLCLAGLGVFTYFNGGIKEPRRDVGLEMNDSITCINTIIKENKKFMWTVVSANDERNMIYDKGYHYEIVDFLRAMEGIASKGTVYIPTPSVYFFIEKVPLPNFGIYDKIGQPISEEGALCPVPAGAADLPYRGRDRWILMSRMYYWCEAFRALYPNEVSIFYETDDFICYRVEQNPYSLFNFAIDYYYNTKDTYSVPNVSEEE